MFKLISVMVMVLIGVKMLNFTPISDRVKMHILSNYASNYINNKWNNDLDNLSDIKITYNFLDDINYVVHDYNNTNQCRYNLLLNGQKFRIGSVLEITNKARRRLNMYKSLKYHPIYFQIQMSLPSRVAAASSNSLHTHSTMTHSS